jgi:hypothetical protein
MIRFVFLVLHTPTEDGEAAQERFSEGTLLTDPVEYELPVVLGRNSYCSAATSKPNPTRRTF